MRRSRRQEAEAWPWPPTDTRHTCPRPPCQPLPPIPSTAPSAPRVAARRRRRCQYTDSGGVRLAVYWSPRALSRPAARGPGRRGPPQRLTASAPHRLGPGVAPRGSRRCPAPRLRLEGPGCPRLPRAHYSQPMSKLFVGHLDYSSPSLSVISHALLRRRPARPLRFSVPRSSAAAPAAGAGADLVLSLARHVRVAVLDPHPAPRPRLLACRDAAADSHAPPARVPLLEPME